MLRENPVSTVEGINSPALGGMQNACPVQSCQKSLIVAGVRVKGL